ncbi:MAG: hypothetical protein IT529_04080 [Burkholderiales bacterium]|nr:hypothetical protein [Burkholderiales bacterium]
MKVNIRRGDAEAAENVKEEFHLSAFSAPLRPIPSSHAGAAPVVPYRSLDGGGKWHRLPGVVYITPFARRAAMPAAS